MMKHAPSAEKWREAGESYRRLTFEKALALVRERWLPLCSESEKQPIMEKRQFAPRVVLAKDLESMEEEHVNWVVQDYISEKSLTLLAGKRAAYKSWLALLIAVCVAMGLPLFGKFATTPTQVLYVDEENGLATIKGRLRRICDGLDIKLGSIERLMIVSHEGIKVQREEVREWLRNLLKEKGRCIVIIDALRRVLSCEENDATEMNEVFTEIFRPIIEETGCSFVLLHHLRKGISEKFSVDLMDELRVVLR